MHISFKQALGGLLLAGAALTAVSAHADVALPSSGNGELTLFVENTTTHEVYAVGLGIFLNDIITEAAAGGTYTGPTNISFTLPAGGIPADANLQQFLSTGSSSEFRWGLLAGDSQGSNAAGTRRYALTTQVDLALPGSTQVPSNNAITGLGSPFESFFALVNSNLPDTAGSSVRGSGSAGGVWGVAGTVGEFAPTFFQTPPNQANGGLGDSNALNFFIVTSAGGGGATAGRVFVMADVSLDANGNLHSVSAVPIPAAVWLLGSGLLGLVGVGRRKRGALAAA